MPEMVKKHFFVQEMSTINDLFTYNAKKKIKSQIALLGQNLRCIPKKNSIITFERSMLFWWDKKQMTEKIILCF